MKNTRKTGKKDDMTLKELLQWLHRRHKLRRRYERDVGRAARKHQTVTAAVFALLVTFALALSMTYAKLHTVPPGQDDGGTQTLTLYGDHPVTNPALQIDEMRCTVNVKLGAEDAFSWETPAVTVADLLADVGYTASPDDIINVPVDTVVEDGMAVVVTCVTFEESAEVVSVPYKTIYKDVQTIPKGETKRVSYGTEGVARQLQKKRYENGVYVSAEVLSEEVVTAPVDEVLQRGVGGTVTGKDGTFAFSYYIDCTATAYGGYDEPRYTYTGTLAKEGVIAVDPDVIPLGSKVYVKGNYGDYGVCSADDIGSGIKDYHIDIFMDATYEEMREFGIRNMCVYFIE